MRIIQDIIIRSNRADYKIKDRICWGTQTRTESGDIIFELEQTRNWFARDHFELKPGFKAIPESDPHEYLITEINYSSKRPFKTILTAVRS